MSAIAFDRFLDKLSAISERDFIDPRALDWPDDIDPEAWYFSPELISLHGTRAWHALDNRQQKRLSFCEAVNFFSLNIHGEKYLISEIGRRLYANDNLSLSQYLTHFIAEESRHMQYFAGFCQRYARGIYPDRSLAVEAGSDAELDTFLLFARINVFEEIVDYYNALMARDERLAPIAREINRIHHVEELRHLAFGRKFLAHCIEQHIDDWDAVRRDELKRYLSDYLRYTWKQYYSIDAYRAAGLANATDVWQAAATLPGAAEHRTRVNDERLGYLRKLELLEH